MYILAETVFMSSSDLSYSPGQRPLTKTEHLLFACQKTQVNAS